MEQQYDLILESKGEGRYLNLTYHRYDGYKTKISYFGCAEYEQHLQQVINSSLADKYKIVKRTKLGENHYKIYFREK